MRTEKKRISIFLKDYVSRKCELYPTKKIDCFCITSIIVMSVILRVALHENATKAN